MKCNKVKDEPVASSLCVRQSVLETLPTKYEKVLSKIIELKENCEAEHAKLTGLLAQPRKRRLTRSRFAMEDKEADQQLFKSVHKVLSVANSLENVMVPDPFVMMLEQAGTQKIQDVKRERPRKIKKDRHQEQKVKKERRQEQQKSSVIKRDKKIKKEQRSNVESRDYFRSQTTVKKPSQMEEDSDNEFENLVQAKMARNCDEMQDCSEKKKRLMKLWNEHVNKNKIRGLRPMNGCLKNFFLDNGAAIMEQGLFWEVCVHLNLLVEEGHLSAWKLKQHIMKLAELKPEEEEAAESLAEEEAAEIPAGEEQAEANTIKNLKRKRSALN